MPLPLLTRIPRELLAKFIKDPRVLIQVSNTLNSVSVDIPSSINTAQDDATLALANAAIADGKAVAAQSTADIAEGKADAAQADADDLAAPEYAVAVADAAIPNARIIVGDTGLTIDITTPNVLQLLLNVITALGYTPANVAGDTFAGVVILSGGVRLGAFTGSADVPVNGYITVMDSTGATKKLATIA